MYRRRMNVVDLGPTRYQSCWDLQRRVLERRIAGVLPDMLLLTEHNNVYTIGTSGDENHLLAGQAELEARGIEVFHIDRGGDITYHGPGQLIGYPVLDLKIHSLDLHCYLRAIEEVIIRTLRRFRIPASRLDGYTGVWVSGEKICAIGIKASRWVTMHGFALNVSTDLTYFQRIIPCGIFERGVTSMSRHLGTAVRPDEVRPTLVEEFCGIFGVRGEDMKGEELMGILDRHFSEESGFPAKEHSETPQSIVEG